MKQLRPLITPQNAVRVRRQAKRKETNATVEVNGIIRQHFEPATHKPFKK